MGVACSSEGACASKVGVLDRAPSPAARETYVDYTKVDKKHFCTPDAEMPPRLALEGPASDSETPPTTLIALLAAAAAKQGGKAALLVERPVPDIADGVVPPALPREAWTTWTWADYLRDVRSVAKAFIGLGMQPFQSVNCWGFNSPEWLIAAMGAVFAGGKIAGLYPTDSPETAAYKVVHSCGSIVVVEDRAKVARLAAALKARGDCRHLRAAVAYGFEPHAGEVFDVGGGGVVRPWAGCAGGPSQAPPLLGWAALVEDGALQFDAALDDRMQAVRPGHCAALIYTSGTTGEPKAVMISHDSVCFEARCLHTVLSKSAGFGASPSEERLLSYLPLSHVAGFVLDIVAPASTTALGPAWAATFFARPYDLKEKAIKDRLGVARPTLFLGVPMVWERIADQVRAIAAEVTGPARSVADWSKRLSLERARAAQLGGDGCTPAGHSLAALVLAKVKARLGLDQCKFALSGAAPMRVDTLEYFGSLNMSINEVYGMSECVGACTWSTDQAHAWGSCGWELPGVEVKAFAVDPRDFNRKVECPRSPSLDATDEEYQGELCFRGRNIMMGYMACPDFGQSHIRDIERKTGETIDNDGWLHSGDKGMVTEQGMVKITGRYKELIIGEGGENIAPVPIEDAVKKHCEGIAEVIMVGDKRKYNIALVTLKAEGANGEVPGSDQLDAPALKVSPGVATISAAVSDPVWIDAVTAAITAANGDGKVCPNNAFTIQKFTILPTNFSEAAGELTPTKKLKRKAVETKFAKLIGRMYASSGTYVPHSG